MEAPVHIGGKFAMQRKYWRKVGLISGSVGAVLACLFGFWFWYAWFGSQPSACFRIRWDNISHTGTSWIAGGNQLLFLHGGTLARYNLQTKQKVWSLDLVTPQDVTDALKAEDEQNTRYQHRHGENPDVMIPRMREKFTRIGLESAYSLRGSGSNVWVAQVKTVGLDEAALDDAMGNESDDTSDDTSDNASRDTSNPAFEHAFDKVHELIILTRYDWNTGNVAQQITLTNNFNQIMEQGDEMVAITAETNGSQTVTHISMNDGAIRTESFFAPAPPHPVELALSGQGSDEGEGGQGGLPLSPNQAGRPMNPAKVAEQAQNMTLPGRIALPALLANSEHNQQIVKEAQSDDNQDQQRRQRRPRRQSASPLSGSDESDDESPTNSRNFALVPDGDSFIAIGEKMIKENLVQRDAMRAPPQHSALDNPNLGVGNESEVVNEQLNEMQRNNGGGTVMEDQSTYQVVLRRTSSTQPDWTGQVVGTPQFYALTNVNVLVAGKTIIVFDKTNKKLWQASLTYPVDGGGGIYGAGPCVENNGTLYVFDQAVLSAFDASNGNARWRIPSVGVVGLFFDDKGALYVNTTTGNPDDIKYSRQIDINKSTQAVVMKVDPASGTILWRSTFGGLLAYVSGQFMYSYRSYDPGDEEDNSDDAISAIMGTANLKIIRISPDNGHVMWEHDEGRAPVDVEFDKNMISVVLKKEVEVLKFISL